MIVDLGLKATIVQLPIQKYLIGCKYYFVNVSLVCLARNPNITMILMFKIILLVQTRYHQNNILEPKGSNI